jgi:hypothetical protein
MKRYKLRVPDGSPRMPPHDHLSLMTGAESNPPPSRVLHFQCHGCGHELAAPSAYAGVEGPCPACQTLVRAPLFEETTAVMLPEEFWSAPPRGPASQAQPLPPAPRSEDRFDPGKLTALPAPAFLTETEALPEGALLTREAEEAAAMAGYRRRSRWLHVFDAALLFLFLGSLAVGAAAIAFTSPGTPVQQQPPELSKRVMERMQQMDTRRDQAVQEARQTLQALLGASDAKAAESLMVGSEKDGAGLPWPLFPGLVPQDMEFIQTRRIRDTERFLSMFEIASNPPVVIPVEQTAAGSRVHSLALTQQLEKRLGTFLSTQEHGGGVFYVLLRPAAAAMAAELIRTRPDLRDYILVSVESAFPADAAAGCLACLKPGSPAAAAFAHRAHDPGLRPAVVEMAWRQHREAGNYVELVSFVPNAWSRH